MAFRYECRDYPGMEACPGSFTAATADEVMRLTELHARIAHEEDPAEWPPEERQKVEGLIRRLA